MMESGELNNTVVVITGSAGGIGAGIMASCAAAGASLVLHHHRSTAPEIPADHLTVQLDLTDPSSPDRLINAAIERYGRVDVLINNAAVQPIEGFLEISDVEWEKLLATNLTSAHRLTQSFARNVRSRHGTGSVIHIASIEGTQPATLHSHYSVSKAGLIMHAKAAAVELGPFGIRVNSVSPGLIHRSGIEEAWPEGVQRWRDRAPLGRLGEPSDVGDACVFLSSSKARWITGVNLIVDGGMSARSTW
jgi:NAD(P)-dependent dehydrogenase (short-subunit alcohol dehydrogenase family)